MEKKKGCMRKDKNGWYLFSKSPASKSFINDDITNILCTRFYVPGVLNPWGIKSGKLSDDKKVFNFDGVINLQGFTAGSYYKDNKNLKKLIKKKEAA